MNGERLCYLLVWCLVAAWCVHAVVDFHLCDITDLIRQLLTLRDGQVRIYKQNLTLTSFKA